MKNISIITDIETGQRTVRFQGDWTPEEKLKARQDFPDIKDLPEKVTHHKKDNGLGERVKELWGEEAYNRWLEEVMNYYNENEATNNKPVKKARSIHAENHSGTIDRLSRIVGGNDTKASINDLINNSLTVNTGGKGKLFVIASIRFEDLPDKLRSKLADKKFFYFLKAVIDSITSLKIAGNNYQSPQTVALAMNGYKENYERAGQEFLKQVEEAIEIGRHTWLKIDATNEAKAKGYNFQEVNFDGPLIPSYGLEVVDMNGQRVKAYEIFKEPILYSYASQKREIYICSADMLALPKKLKLTVENVILQRYLIERIEGMKNPHNVLGPVILYETIYQVLGIQETSREYKRKTRDKVKKFLDNWKDLAYIKDYHEESQGGLIRSIRIDLFEHEKLNS